MKPKLLYKPLILAAMLTGFSGAVVANDGTMTSAVGGLTIATAADPTSEALAAIAADRYGTIAGITAIWRAELDGDDAWEAGFTAALNKATEIQLLNIQNATDYDAVRAILQGRDAPVQMEAVIGTEALGDLTQDLVFTPVVPCRIFDTRNDNDPNPGHPTGPATTKNYLVHGNLAQMQAQGGDTACVAPQGEPVGIHGNFTADPFDTPTGKKGNIRVWPFGGVLPGVSLVNYETAVNIANTASVGTCYLCSGDLDLNVTTTFFGSDQIGDVMGYYYPANLPLKTVYHTIPAHSCAGTTTGSDNCSGIITRTEANNFPCIALIPTTRATYTCPLNLPDGALIDEIVMTVSDGDSNGYLEGWAYSQPNDISTSWAGISSTFGNVWQTTGISATPGIHISLELLPLSDPSIMIDNQNRQYAVQFGGRGHGTVWAQSIRVRYRTRTQ